MGLRNAWLRRAAMIGSPSPTTSDNPRICCTYCHSRRPEPTSESCRARISPPTLAMLNQAHRARMVQNRERALFRLHNKQNLMNATKHTFRMPVPHGGAQLSIPLSGIDLAVPTAVNNQQNISLPGTIDLGSGGPTSTSNQQDMRLMEQDCGLNAPFSGLLKKCTNFQGLEVVVSESNITAEERELLGSASSVRAQEFDYVVVIDFEATCDKNMEKLKPQEIIEFPAVLVDCQQLTLGDFFQTYVKPEHHPILSEFCTRLTGIEQEQVDKGMSLSDAIYSHDNWLEKNGIKDKKFAVLIWSDWDCKVMLESECNLKGLEKPHYFNRWINLKALFQSAFNGRKCNLRKAVEASGLQWLGRAHCGLHDAINTARLAIELMRRGTILTVTSSLEAEAAVSDIGHPEHPGPISGNFSTGFKSSDGSANCIESSLGLLDGSGVSKQSRSYNAQSSVGLVNMTMTTVLCYCGVICKRHSVKKAGPNHGKHFFACGRWTPTEGSRCGFFEWAVS